MFSCQHKWAEDKYGEKCQKCGLVAEVAFEPDNVLVFVFPDNVTANDFKSWLLEVESQYQEDLQEGAVGFDWYQGSVVPCKLRKKKSKNG